jgi:predicted nucleotidyltransferase
MKICAIICEYNPLHFGHWYHIQKAKELSGCDAIMCIQAGNFTQRGEPAITNKYIRSRMALEAGADIVVIGNYFEQNPQQLPLFIQAKNDYANR